MGTGFNVWSVSSSPPPSPEYNNRCSIFTLSAWLNVCEERPGVSFNYKIKSRCSKQIMHFHTVNTLSQKPFASLWLWWSLSDCSIIDCAAVLLMGGSDRYRRSQSETFVLLTVTVNCQGHAVVFTVSLSRSFSMKSLTSLHISRFTGTSARFLRGAKEFSSSFSLVSLVSWSLKLSQKAICQNILNWCKAIPSSPSARNGKNIINSR